MKGFINVSTLMVLTLINAVVIAVRAFTNAAILMTAMLVFIVFLVMLTSESTTLDGLIFDLVNSSQTKGGIMPSANQLFSLYFLLGFIFFSGEILRFYKIDTAEAISNLMLDEFHQATKSIHSVPTTKSAKKALVIGTSRVGKSIKFDEQ